MPRRLSLDDGTVARSAAFCRHQLIFPTHADSPAQRAFTDSGSLCFCFPLSLHAQILSPLQLCWSGNRVRHIPGERMQPSAEAAPCRKPFPLSFCWFICSVFVPAKKHDSTTPAPKVNSQSSRHRCLYYFLCFLKNLPLGPYCLLTEVGWGRKIILGTHDMCARLCAAGLLCSAFL